MEISISMVFTQIGWRENFYSWCRVTQENRVVLELVCSILVTNSVLKLFKKNGIGIIFCV